MPSSSRYLSDRKTKALGLLLQVEARAIRAHKKLGAGIVRDLYIPRDFGRRQGRHKRIDESRAGPGDDRQTAEQSFPVSSSEMNG